MVMAGVAWGDGIIHLECRPLNPVIGQSYTFGNDPNTHTYIGGDGWYSTCLHWTETTGEPVKFKRVNQPRTNEMKAVSLNRYINSEIATNRVYKIGEIIDGTNVYPVVVGEMVFDTTPEQIRKLARSGKICEVLGHWWEVESVFTFFTSDPNSPMESRKCKLCGKVETKTVEWK